jgi:uncharacterized membrane protein YgdD (TMEM256/DUF423 family)
MSYRISALAAGILGLSGVILGALGAHGRLRDLLDQAGTHAQWETAVQYQLIHAIALLSVALWLKFTPSTHLILLSWTARLWMIGVLLFSGSIYWLSLGGPRGLGPLTPIGGLALIAGWTGVIIAAARKDRAPTA